MRPILSPAHENKQWPIASEILAEYLATLPEAARRGEFIADVQYLPGNYAPPQGAFYLAWVDDVPAGCCALRALEDGHYMHAVEIRRLYVRPAFRGLGLGRELVEKVLDVARQMGYSCALLDTLDTVEVARDLYKGLNFYEIEPFHNSPIPGAHYLKVEL